MSLWHCKEHGLVGPEACCPQASRASISEISASGPPEPPTPASDEGPDPSRDDNWCCECGRFHHKTIAALRAELADARADEERLDWLEKWLPEQPGHRRLVFDRSVPEFTLFQSDDNVRRLGMKKTLRAAIDAARAASGEDASHQQTGRARQERDGNG